MKSINFITNNLALKVLAVCLAVILWLAARGGGQIKREVRVPVTVQNLSPHLKIDGDLPHYVQVVVSGSRIRLLSFHPEKLSFDLDLQSLGAGVATFPLARGTLRLPRGINTERISPAFLEVRIVEVPRTVHDERSAVTESE